jgi:phosphorylcholine metabolism protein LicD
MHLFRYHVNCIGTYKRPRPSTNYILEETYKGGGIQKWSKTLVSFFSDVKFEVLTAALIQIYSFCNVLLCP